MMYAFYPEVEMYEVEDYAAKFKFDPDTQECFPTDWRYEPRNDAYPIKTYVDFELDKDPKEEYKVDPLAEVIERMSILRPDEQMWVQIVITQCRDTEHSPGKPFWETGNRYINTIHACASLQLRRYNSSVHRFESRQKTRPWRSLPYSTKASSAGEMFTSTKSATP